MPRAEVILTETTVRRLLADQATGTIAGATSSPLRLVAEGWDNSVWRLGAEWAVRLPRRALSAGLIAHEQRWLPALARPVVAASGLTVPVPVVAGRPGAGYPWRWSVVPWIPGASGLTTPRARRSAWAEPLARALRALHRPAPADHPRNPYRGVPLAERADPVSARFVALRASGLVDAPDLHAAERAWSAARESSPWAGPPVWIHGDVHPGNLVARDDRLVALIDFGDLTAGDPSYDLAIAWLAFDAVGRARFRAEYGGDDDSWRRARGWAAAIGALLIGSDDPDPAMRELGRESLVEVRAELGR